MIDTHAHIYAEEFDKDRDEMIERAREAGVEAIILPNVDSSTLDDMLQLEAKYPGYCFAAIGLHPTSVKENYEEELRVVRKELERRKYIAIGETGMDLYWDKKFEKEQVLALQKQAEWALEYDLPIIIHVRESHNETVKALQPFKGSKLKGVFHCFTKTKKKAEEIFELGDFYLGIGGVVTFRNSGLAKNLDGVPLDRLILETDAPYLAPVPYRGKRNEPAYLEYIRKKLSDVYQISENDIDKITTENAKQLFSIDI